MNVFSRQPYLASYSSSAHIWYVSGTSKQ